MTKTIIKIREAGLKVPAMTASFGGGGLSNLRNMYALGNQHYGKALLKNIDFELQAGDKLGILGKNGAGKTTLLRLVGGVYKPTSGTVEIFGKAHGIFDVRLGMSDQATGYENIILRGLQFGLSVKEIKKLMPEVIEFAELKEGAMNERLASYSTGMQLRLSMATSLMISPEILIMDEWIGAGDAGFQTKLKLRLDQMIDMSKCLLLATHAKHLLRTICNKGLVLLDGEQAFFGDIDSAIEFYEERR